MKADAPENWALAFPRCRSVHTFGMRFPIDVVFLDRDGRVVRQEPNVGRRKVLFCAKAHTVLETRAGQGEIIVAMAPEASNRFARALDPRVPIYRDSYNEYFVFLLSAGGAVAGTQVPLYIVMAITGIWNVAIFTAACVIFELAVIFGLARPQMRAQERIGWVLLWSFATAVMAVIFYYLVADPTL